VQKGKIYPDLLMEESHRSKKSFSELLTHNDFGLRLLIALISWLCLTLFFQFREQKIETLDLHSTVNRYIVAQVDFEFPDDEATIILKQEALLGISDIYKILESQLQQARLDFENFLLQSSRWKEELPNSNYQQMVKTADSLEELLLTARFADPKTIQKMKELNLPVNQYLVFTPLSNQDPILLPQEYWSHLKEISLSKVLFFQLNDVGEETIDFVVSFFEQKQWTLIPDHSAVAHVKELVQKNVPQKFTRVKAGTRIIGQGEKVTPRHLAMLHAMKNQIREGRNLWNSWMVVGNSLLAFVFVFFAAFYLKREEEAIWKSVQKLSLLVCIFILTLSFAKITEYVFLQNTSNFIETIRYPLIVPFATLLIMILLGSHIALFSSALLAVIMTISLAVEPYYFLVSNIVAALVVVIGGRSFRTRREVFLLCCKCYFGVIPVILAFALLVQKFWIKVLILDMTTTALFTVVMAILVVGFLTLLESLFNILTDITLMEYMNPNNELLRRLTLEMPGTYQHSLVLGNLSESAAQAIGANGLLCKVATLYHDIGKLANPHFFTENQKGGVNVHQLLTPQESAQIIISHVTDGETLARKYRLPQCFIDVIREHHGTTLVYYFYCKELELKGGNKDVVDEKAFRYPGPKPQSKETAIVMIADAVEAASRSLEELSEDALSTLVDRVVADKAKDGQFDESPMTFEELKIVKETLIGTIIVTRHIRIKYPEKEKV
jgi:cyclic-di-AMP phosphodiesterase PgpH